MWVNDLISLVKKKINLYILPLKNVMELTQKVNLFFEYLIAKLKPEKKILTQKARVLVTIETKVSHHFIPN